MNRFRQAITVVVAFIAGCLFAGFLMLRYLAQDPAPPPTVTHGTATASHEASPDAASGWQTAPGFQVGVDAEGFLGPVSLAFLNRPGTEPDSPLYLVTELRGTIKVVSRDRTVRVFGEIPDRYLADTVLPRDSAAYGLHGICIDPEDRFLFTTAVYPDGDRALNRITLWESTGEVPWARGRAVRELREPLASLSVASGHSIGQCLIGADGKLWVGVGDGGRVQQTHRPSSPAGKVLRLNLDLSAPPDNPFYDPARPAAIESYVYTMGLRNPWALAEGPHDAVYVADNGPSVDRLVRAKRGYDYPWYGRDDSLTFDNLLLWPRPVGPASMLFVETNPTFPFLRDALVVAASSVTALLLVPLGEDGTVRDVPAYLMRRSRPSYPVEALTGTAVGPDGLYVAHMVYDAEEFFKPSSILRITPGSFERGGITLSGQDLLRASGCLGCHSHRGEGNSLSPDLDQVAARIAGRLADADYLATLRRLDRHSDPEISRLAEMRQRVLAASGEERIALWIRAKVAFPRFDDPAAEMAHIPNLSEQDIEAIAVFLARSGARGGRL